MFRKPKKKNASLLRQKKKRSLDNDGEGSDDDISNTTKNVAKNKKRFRRRSSSSDEEEENSHSRNGNANTHSNDDGDDDNEESTTSLLQQIKNESKKKGRDAISSNKKKGDNSFMHEFKSSDKPMTQKELATLESEFHPSNLTNSRSEREKETSSSTIEGAEKPTRNKFLAGPIKASKFIRTTSRFDYQPDICKDFKDTGFCGFGDSCIYLHDRTNMKSGFQLEQEWELRKKREQERKEREMENFCRVVGGGSYQNDDDNVIEDDGIPFACHLCREHFKDPVVTQCGHYFCQTCILKRVQEECDPTCPICQQDMCGVFNYPTKLVNKKKKVVGRRGTWEEYLIKMKG